MYKSVPECTKVFQSILGSTKVYQSLLRCTKVYQSILGCIKVYQSVLGWWIYSLSLTGTTTMKHCAIFIVFVFSIDSNVQGVDLNDQILNIVLNQYWEWSCVYCDLNFQSSLYWSRHLICHLPILDLFDLDTWFV